MSEDNYAALYSVDKGSSVVILTRYMNNKCLHQNNKATLMYKINGIKYIIEWHLFVIMENLYTDMWIIEIKKKLTYGP